jgi:hypothetical protein
MINSILGRAGRVMLGVAVTAVATVALALAVTSGPAAAAGTYVQNNNDCFVAAACVPGTGCSNSLVLGNGRQVLMTCWFDRHPPATGNYSSVRWFRVGVVPYPGLYNVHSSYVFNQTGVGRC